MEHRKSCNRGVWCWGSCRETKAVLHWGLQRKREQFLNTNVQGQQSNSALWHLLAKATLIESLKPNNQWQFSKQDVFVGFATVPGFVSLTSTEGSPYLQESSISSKNLGDTLNFRPSLLSLPVIMTLQTWRTSIFWSRENSHQWRLEMMESVKVQKKDPAFSARFEVKIM